MLFEEPRFVRFNPRIAVRYWFLLFLNNSRFYFLPGPGIGHYEVAHGFWSRDRVSQVLFDLAIDFVSFIFYISCKILDIFRYTPGYTAFESRFELFHLLSGSGSYRSWCGSTRERAVTPRSVHAGYRHHCFLSSSSVGWQRTSDDYCKAFTSIDVALTRLDDSQVSPGFYHWLTTPGSHHCHHLIHSTFRLGVFLNPSPTQRRPTAHVIFKGNVLLVGGVQSDLGIQSWQLPSVKVTRQP